MRRPGRVLGIVGTGMLVALLLMATVGPALTREDPTERSGLPLQPPSAEHFLGTDDAGRDIFAQFVEGAQVSLMIGVLSAVIAVVVGLGVALVAGYYRGGVDSAFMRLVDITLALPFLPLVLVLSAFFGRGLWTTVLVIGLGLWARPARVLRSQVLKVREFDHVLAAQAMGARTHRVLGRHILPRVVPLAGAQFIRAANIGVMIEAALAFLGLSDPARMSWGTMLYFANARNAILTDAWMWWILPPGFGLTAAVLGFAFLGYAIEERTDPRLRTQVSKPSTPAPPVTREKDPTEREESPQVLRLEGLSVGYDTATGTDIAVDDVTFSVRQGRITGLVGESGCGKTTLLLALLGLLPSAGRVTGGQAVFKGRVLLGADGCVREVRGRDIAMVPQSAMNTLNPAYPVHRQVAEAAALTRSREAARRRASELLEMVGIPANRHRAFPHEFSGGMRQRVVIAMALANEPALLLADEPTTGLDVVTQGSLLRLLLDLQERLGLTVLLISHDLSLIGQVADDVLVMDEGKIVESGTAEEVTGSPTHSCTCRLVESTPSVEHAREARPEPPAADAATVLQLRSVTRCFPGRGLRKREPVVALEDVSLEIAEGQVLGLVGESGSGKSTLARTVVGMERPDHGQVIVEGNDIAQLSRRDLREARRCMHLVLQDPYQSLHPGMTLREAVGEPLIIAGHDRDDIDARVAEVLEEVGLSPNLRERHPHELSGGQRQRTAFARALIGRPRLIVADEPTSMLDVSLQASLLRLVADLRDRYGIAFLFITHDLAVARHIADRIAVLHEGRIVECRPADDVITDPDHDYTRTLVATAKDPTAVPTGA